MVQLKNILVPTDFSDTSLPSLRYAAELARNFCSAIHLLYVIEDPVEFLPAFGGYTPDRAAFEEFARTGLDAWAITQDLSGIEVTKRFVHGKPSLSIIRYAERHDIDMIVMGTHGRGFTGHLLMGSVAEQVVRHAKCPTLTIKPSNFKLIPDVSKKSE
jgi:nucleotide-binding universal stress UspA family protein